MDGFGIGLLKQKKALVINTTAIVEEYYKAHDLQDAFIKISSATFKTLGGIPNVDHVTFYGVPIVDDETRKKYLETAFRLGKEF